MIDPDSTYDEATNPSYGWRAPADAETPDEALLRIARALVANPATLDALKAEGATNAIANELEALVAHFDEEDALDAHLREAGFADDVEVDRVEADDAAHILEVKATNLIVAGADWIDTCSIEGVARWLRAALAGTTVAEYDASGEHDRRMAENAAEIRRGRE